VQNLQDEAPVSSVYWFVGQVVHEVWPPEEKVEGRQMVHVLVEASAYFPGSQKVHAVMPEVEAV